MSACEVEDVHLILVRPAPRARIHNTTPPPVRTTQELRPLINATRAGELPGQIRRADPDRPSRTRRRSLHLHDEDLLSAFVLRSAEGPAGVDEAEAAVESDDGAVDGPLVFGHAF